PSSPHLLLAATAINSAPWLIRRLANRDRRHLGRILGQNHNCRSTVSGCRLCLQSPYRLPAAVNMKNHPAITDRLAPFA
ncbi:hypothetical protein, partial [Burkholderia sp. IT-111MI5]|uniref:hypothetical protein n=1 Tax=Burkholderia sp. IT-111MI5 TaxID=3026439 RepID=UPI0039DF41CD